MLQIETDHNKIGVSAGASFYKEAATRLLTYLLPESMLCANESDPDLWEDEKEKFSSMLPLFSHTSVHSSQERISFIFLWEHKSHAFRFVFDMISRWLCPGKRLNITTLFGLDIRLPALSDAVYTVCEITLSPQSEQEWEEINRNIPLITSEIKLGVKSKFIAWRILEVKGLSSDEKTSILLEQLNFLIKRMPSLFDSAIITEMQHLLVISPDNFVNMRSARHLARIIAFQYLFRKDLNNCVVKNSEERYVKVKLLKSRSDVLGIVLAINFLGENEVFEEKHILQAIKNYCPQAKAVEGSFFSNRRPSEKVCTLYIEITKDEGHIFDSSEIAQLQAELPYELQDSIEHLMHPVFMQRNEEDLMRNTLNLSSQIKYVKDLPQVFIAYDEQTRDSLLFTVIVVRVIMPEGKSIKMLLTEAGENSFEYIHDRSKMVGLLRKKYAKEATVFRARLPKALYLRSDGSIDLNKSRQVVINGLTRVLGDVRDYNGGMISKQNEQFCQLRQILEGKVRYNELLLENFFYAITPVFMRTIIDVELLALSFSLLNGVIDERLFKNGAPILKTLETSDAFLAVVSVEDDKLKSKLTNIASQMHLPADAVAHSYLQVYNIPYICLIYRSHDYYQLKRFHKVLQGLLNYHGNPHDKQFDLGLELFQKKEEAQESFNF